MSARRRVIIAAGAATSALLAGGCASFSRPDVSAGGAPARWTTTALVGGGVSAPLGRPALAREVGVAAIGGVEAGSPSGRFGIRAEGGVASNPLRVTGLAGDVQSVRASLLLRWVPVAPARRVAPYVVGGAGWTRPSTRLTLREGGAAVPDAHFEQVTHENVAAALLGGGLTFRVAKVTAFAEARWEIAATADESTQSLPVLLGVRLPLR